MDEKESIADTVCDYQNSSSVIEKMHLVNLLSTK